MGSAPGGSANWTVSDHGQRRTSPVSLSSKPTQLSLYELRGHKNSGHEKPLRMPADPSSRSRSTTAARSATALPLPSFYRRLEASIRQGDGWRRLPHFAAAVISPVRPHSRPNGAYHEAVADANEPMMPPRIPEDYRRNMRKALTETSVNKKIEANLAQQPLKTTTAERYEQGRANNRRAAFPLRSLCSLSRFRRFRCAGRQRAWIAATA